MARIRIVDEWLRSPVSAPARQRAILVVARSWAEQRVLMRAFAASSDQTRPTINLHGEELAIGPAGVDPHGEWGIHVQPPVDGRAQELREALQLAAKLLAGSKGNPPRLQDEQPEFEERATHNWAPSEAPKLGEPGRLDEPGRRTVFGHDGGPVPVPEPQYYEPALHAPTSDSQEIPSSGASRSKNQMRKTPAFWADVYETPELEQGVGARPVVVAQPQASASRSRSLRQTNRYSGVMASQSGAIASQSMAQPEVLAQPAKKKAAKTVFGFEPQKPAKKETFAATASKTMPIGLRLDDNERLVLNELGKQIFLSAGGIARLLQVSDPMEWMSRFMDKLAEFGLDLVAPGNDQDGEATYQLIR